MALKFITKLQLRILWRNSNVPPKALPLSPIQLPYFNLSPPMKILFILSLIVIAALAMPRCTPTDLSKCGIDTDCWTCDRNNRCAATNIGGACDDKNPLTYNDQCQRTGDCSGKAMMCIPCTTDASCGDTLSLVTRVRAGLWQWMQPWQSLLCLNATCLTDTDTGRKCCGFTPTPKVPCDDRDPNTICWGDGSCKPTPASKTELCERVADHCTTVRDCDRIPNMPPCLQLLCTRRTCNVGYKASGAPCGLNGVCDGKGTCNITCPGGGGGAGCASGLTLCSGSCVNLATDPLHCGTCSTQCGTNQACLDSACVYKCPISEKMCNGECVDITSDDTNCGDCGIVCQSGKRCISRNCQPVCTSAQTLCSGSCVDVNTDPNNCGTCGNACSPSQACSAGVCTLVCLSPQAPCPTVSPTICADFSSSNTDCGHCGTICPSGSVCVAGTCTALCPSPHVLCSGVCLDTSTDPSNCGSCGNVCPSGKACVSGSCRPLCQPPLYACTSGSCNNLAIDNNNCGACSHICPTGQQCVAGQCKVICPVGQTNCSGTCTVIQNDPINCGVCGTVCPVGASHTQGVCASGVCETACTPPYSDCDGNSANGCESNYNNDVTHCGTPCGSACPVYDHTAPTCTSGVCGWFCSPSNWKDCNANYVDGCEVDTLTNAANCGVCGHVCTAPANAVATCIGGSCGFTCNVGYADCNGFSSDGCEINKNTDLSNCGSCGNVCPARAHAVTTCTSGVCGFTCNAGYADCDLNAANGCEMNTNTNTNNCGSCGNACPARANAVTTCASGVCGYTCNTGYDDCNGLASDGCEINKNTDLSNCGSCSHKCGFEQYCSSGTCQRATLIYIISGDGNPTEVYNTGTGQLNSSYPAFPINRVTLSGISVNNSIYVLTPHQLLGFMASVFNKITYSWTNLSPSINSLSSDLSQIWKSGNILSVADNIGSEFNYNILTNTFSKNVPAPDIGTLTVFPPSTKYIYYLPKSYVQGATTSTSPINTIAGITAPANGLIYVNEFTSGGSCSNSFAVYNTTQRLQSLTNIPTPICSSGGSILSGNKIYAAGGYTLSSVPTRSFQIYDITSNTWTSQTLVYNHIGTTLVVG